MFKRIWEKIKSFVDKWQADKNYKKAAKAAGWGSENDPVKQPEKKRTSWFRPSKTPHIKDNGRNNSGKHFIN
ncbi:MAG: hypothetical protein WBJ81_06230 [Rickettsiales bacterium]